MSLEQLDAWLYTLEPAPRVDGVSMLDGYLTAIVIGPCSIRRTIGLSTSSASAGELPLRPATCSPR